MAFTESIYLDLKSIQSEVKMQALCPGFTKTEFHNTIGTDRHRLAPCSLFLRTEYVVEESLRALPAESFLLYPGGAISFLFP